MKSNFLEIAGVNSEAEFYQKYPSEAAFFAAHPEAQMLQTMKSGGNAPTNPTLWSKAKSLAKQKFDVYPCVPLNSEALTKDGWKNYHELTVGEEILSYNRDSGTTEWAPILALQYFKDAPLIRLYKAQTNCDVKCTPNHKWVLDSPNVKYPDNLVEAQNITSHMKIKTSAPIKVEDQAGVDLQAFSKSDSWVKKVLMMSVPQLQAFFASGIVYDGYDKGLTSKGDKQTFGFSQKNPDHGEAMEIAAVLLGYRVCSVIKKHNPSMRTWTFITRSFESTQNLKKEDAGIEDVWCPTTKNQTWVMRQNGYVTITGNSAYANGWAAKWYKGKGGGWRKAEYGGMMMAESGMPDNPGFNALPSAVQQKIVENMAYGGDVDLEQMREGGIPERYKNMGFNSVGKKKNSTRPGKKWMVLAKKGDDYKVVHGGYDGMKDYTQHGSEERRKRFWDRMGGKDSAKAKDPFSPLYWHKRFGTWQQGGSPMPPQLLMKENYRDINAPYRSMSMEADRSGDAMIMSTQGQKMMEDKLRMQQQQEAFRMANPNYDEQAMRAQLIQKYGVMKDGDFFPSKVYLNERGRIVPPGSSGAEKLIAKTAQSAMNYKKGGSTYSGGVWFQQGGNAINVPNVMGNIQEKLMDQYVNPYSLNNMTNFAGNIIEGFNNRKDMRDALDTQRQNYSTDYMYMPTGDNTMSRGQYDMYGQMFPDRIGGNLSFTGMNQKYSTGVPRLQEGGGLSNFDFIADVVTPVVTDDPIGKARKMINMVAADNTRVEKNLPMEATAIRSITPTRNDDTDIRMIIGAKESSNNYGALPKRKDGTLASSAVGKYQFLWNGHKEKIQALTGISSKEDFRNNPDAQEKYFNYWNDTVLTPIAEDIKKAFNPNYSMNEIKQIIHFQGPTGAKKFFSTGEYTKDAFGSTPSSYLKKQYAKGGEIEVTPAELAQILKMGGQVEFC
jgi:hypothetical protein